MENRRSEDRRSDPFTSEEIQVLRALIAEHRYRTDRGLFVSRFYSRGRVVIGALFACIVLALQVIGIYVAAGH